MLLCVRVRVSACVGVRSCATYLAEWSYRDDRGSDSPDRRASAAAWGNVCRRSGRPVGSGACASSFRGRSSCRTHSKRPNRPPGSPALQIKDNESFEQYEQVIVGEEEKER